MRNADSDSGHALQITGGGMGDMGEDSSTLQEAESLRQWPPCQPPTGLPTTRRPLITMSRLTAEQEEVMGEKHV